MRKPSIKRLCDALGLSPIEAAQVRDAMDLDWGLAEANRIMEARAESFGVERIALPEGSESTMQGPDITIRYVNRGETYKITLLRVYGVGEGAYRLQSWGDALEAIERRYPSLRPRD